MAPRAELALVGADIHTMDPAHPRATSLAIFEGRIVAVGDEWDVRPWVGRQTRVVQGRGLFAMPGFFDSHNHMLNTGLALIRPGLDDARSVADVQAIIARSVTETPDGDWVQTSASWHEAQLAEGRLPTARELDSVSPGHPVAVRRGGHNLILNSAAMRVVGLHPTAENPSGGTFHRTSDGNLSGQVTGKGAIDQVVHRLPPITEDERTRALAVVGRAYAAAGITSLVEPGLDRDDLTWLRGHVATGDFPVRVSALWRPPLTGRTAREAAELVRDCSPRWGRSGDWYRVLGVKLLADGGVETGFYRESYQRVDDPSHPRGKPLISEEVLVAVARELVRRQVPTGIHVVGDAAADLVLKALAQAARDEYRTTLPEWSLIHLLSPRPDQWASISALDLMIAVQPSLHYQLAAGFIEYLGRERAARALPLATMLSLRPGRLAGGSDSPVAPFPPLMGIAAAVTRRTRFGRSGLDSERISVGHALELFTSASASYADEAQTRGCLAPGRVGDVVLLAENPTLVSPERLAEIEVVQTIAGGRVTHDGLTGQ